MNILASAICFLLASFSLLQLPKHQEKAPDPSKFSIVGVTIGQDNLQSLLRKLGPAKKCHTAGHVEIAGYTDSKENLVFEFGEVGAGSVTAFYLSLPGKPVGCPLSALPADISALSTKGGIHLGMTEEEVARILGPPKNRPQKGDWRYHWEWQVKLTEEEKRAQTSATPGYTVSDTADVAITIKARFVRGVLQYFYVSKLEVT